jgi:hypothetical protein
MREIPWLGQASAAFLCAGKAEDDHRGGRALQSGSDVGKRGLHLRFGVEVHGDDTGSQH